MCRAWSATATPPPTNSDPTSSARGPGSTRPVVAVMEEGVIGAGPTPPSNAVSRSRPSSRQPTSWAPSPEASPGAPSPSLVSSWSGGSSFGPSCCRDHGGGGPCLRRLGPRQGLAPVVAELPAGPSRGSGPGPRGRRQPHDRSNRRRSHVRLGPLQASRPPRRATAGPRRPPRAGRDQVRRDPPRGPPSFPPCPAPRLLPLGGGRVPRPSPLRNPLLRGREGVFGRVAGGWATRPPEGAVPRSFGWSLSEAAPSAASRGRRPQAANVRNRGLSVDRPRVARQRLQAFRQPRISTPSR